MSKRAGDSNSPDSKKQRAQSAAAAAASSSSQTIAATASGIPTCQMLSLVQQLPCDETLTVHQMDALCCPACRLAEQLHHMHWCNVQLCMTLQNQQEFGPPDSPLRTEWWWLYVAYYSGDAEQDADLYWSDAPEYLEYREREVRIRTDVERFAWKHAIRPVMDQLFPAKLSQLIGSYWTSGITQNHGGGADRMDDSSSSSCAAAAATPSR